MKNGPFSSADKQLRENAGEFAQRLVRDPGGKRGRFRARIRLRLAGFEERHETRARLRRERLARSLSCPLPVGMVARRVGSRP